MAEAVRSLPTSDSVRGRPRSSAECDLPNPGEPAAPGDAGATAAERPGLDGPPTIPPRSLPMNPQSAPETAPPGDPAECELTFLFPCLNEAETVAGCIAEVRQVMERHGLTGEILVADNGSTDGTRRVIHETLGRKSTVVQPGKITPAGGQENALISIGFFHAGQFAGQHLQGFIRSFMAAADMVN